MQEMVAPPGRTPIITAALDATTLDTRGDMDRNGDSVVKRTAAWRRYIALLLVIPYAGVLWVSSYTSVTPELWGIPFFYWYQFLWIGIGAVVTILVYAAERQASVSGNTPPSTSQDR
jgi:hypothetical protein